MFSRLGTGAVFRGGLAGALLAGLSLALWAGATRSQATPREEKPLRVLVHVNFADVGQQERGLHNVENILKAAVATGVTAEVEVVCHTDGIILLQKDKSAHAAPVEALIKKGVRFAACENTMRQRKIRREDLIPDVTTVPSGAFEVVRRQQDGYSYFKP